MPTPSSSSLFSDVVEVVRNWICAAAAMHFPPPVRFNHDPSHRINNKNNNNTKLCHHRPRLLSAKIESMVVLLVLKMGSTSLNDRPSLDDLMSTQDHFGRARIFLFSFLCVRSPYSFNIFVCPLARGDALKRVLL